ncbi:GTP cyclohydrolase FolE2 [Porticoccus sp. GXU_MW_L64]
MNQPIRSPLPDVAALELPDENQDSLDWVGMKQISLPLIVNDRDIGCFSASAQVQTYVDLSQSKSKGIHMSRLYLALMKFAESGALTFSRLHKLMEQFLDSHQSLSSQTVLHFSFDSLIKRPALLSGNNGWKSYATQIRTSLNTQGAVFELGLSIPYSSTCPCSAALSRQVLRQAFEEDFAQSTHIDKHQVGEWLQSERGSVATPHSQRSYANIWVKLAADTDLLPITQLIGAVEEALQTPVQTAVKREDEQEFARRNGANLMFCEDAARRLKQALNQQADIVDFWVQVDHRESLHAHDASAYASKGIDSGYRPIPQPVFNFS